jgi:hypothetical protein
LSSDTGTDGAGTRTEKVTSSRDDKERVVAYLGS